MASPFEPAFGELIDMLLAGRESALALAPASSCDGSSILVDPSTLPLSARAPSHCATGLADAWRLSPRPALVPRVSAARTFLVGAAALVAALIHVALSACVALLAQAALCQAASDCPNRCLHHLEQVDNRIDQCAQAIVDADPSLNLALEAFEIGGEPVVALLELYLLALDSVDADLCLVELRHHPLVVLHAFCLLLL